MFIFLFWAVIPFTAIVSVFSYPGPAEIPQSSGKFPDAGPGRVAGWEGSNHIQDRGISRPAVYGTLGAAEVAAPANENRPRDGLSA